MMTMVIIILMMLTLVIVMTIITKTITTVINTPSHPGPFISTYPGSLVSLRRARTVQGKAEVKPVPTKPRSVFRS